MTQYVRFPTTDGGFILIEVSEAATQSDERKRGSGGMVKAGLGDKVAEAGKKVTGAIIQSSSSFEGTLMDTIRRNAEAFIRTMSALSDPPAEAEISFGLKATGEVGLDAAAIARASGEATYNITLTWKREKK